MKHLDMKKFDVPFLSPEMMKIKMQVEEIKSNKRSFILFLSTSLILCGIYIATL